MPTPPKPYKILAGEKKSHRTKAELELRKQGEKALASGKALKEREEVKSNEFAHKEFRRINNLLKEIKKNDALYEPVINRYCAIQAECSGLESERAYMMNLTAEMQSEFKKAKDKVDDPIEIMSMLIEFSQTVTKLNAQIAGLDKTLLSKRKMLLDIERENVMTVAAALRSIPKKEEKAENPLLEVLRNG